MSKSKLRFKVGVRVIDGVGYVSLLDKKAVLDSRPDCTFCFLSKNKITCIVGNVHSGCTNGKTQHIYQRQRRGARITWLDFSAVGEPNAVTGELVAQLELAYGLMEAEKHTVEMERFVALTKKAKAARAGK